MSQTQSTVQENSHQPTKSYSRLSSMIEFLTLQDLTNFHPWKFVNSFGDKNFQSGKSEQVTQLLDFTGWFDEFDWYETWERKWEHETWKLKFERMLKTSLWELISKGILRMSWIAVITISFHSVLYYSSMNDECECKTTISCYFFYHENDDSLAKLPRWYFEI